MRRLILPLVGLLAVLGLTAPARASALAMSCAVLQNTPTYASGVVRSVAEVDCFGSPISIYMESWLTRNGTQVDHSYAYGSGTEYEYWPREVSAPNIAGNQSWCASTVVTNANTGAVLDSDNACENQAWRTTG